MFSGCLFRLILLLSCCYAVIGFPLQFQNIKAIRSIDVRHNVIREEIGIRATNMDTTVASEYYLYSPSVLNDSIATVTAFNREDKQALLVELYEVDINKGMDVYRIQLNKPIPPTEDTVLIVKIAYIHVTRPLPAQLPQIARQFTHYVTNSYFISPYFTKEVRTTVITPSSNIASHSGAQNKSNANGNKVVFGPYYNIVSYAFDKAVIHYENPKPMITIRKLQRDIELSHWGNNMAVEEHYSLHNDGASLDKEFNRVQYQMTQHVHDQLNIVKSIHFTLPVDAHGVYYRDGAGNVSTSYFRTDKDSSSLEVFPRFPIMGGWSYEWYQGYNSALGHYVHQTSSGRYILNVKYVDNIQDMAVDDVSVRIVLPEGASHPKIIVPFSVEQDIQTHYSYFDSTGRLMIILNKKNVIKDHEDYIQVEYDYKKSRYLQKPLVASSAIFLVFFSSILFSKLYKKDQLKTE